jgi:hypothetical protein
MSGKQYTAEQSTGKLREAEIQSDQGRKLAGVLRGAGGVPVVFFVLFFLYVWQYLDPRLLYYADRVSPRPGYLMSFPVFSMDMGFFRDFLSYPGGLSEYASAFLSQYYYFSFAGALILTAVALLSSMAADALIKKLGGKRSRSLKFVPPLFILMLFNRYTFHLENYLSLIAALAAANVYLRVRLRNPLTKLLFFFVVSAALYYAAGAPFFLFAVLCTLFEVLVNRRYATGALYAATAAGVPLVGRTVFVYTSLADCYWRPSGLYPSEGALETAILSSLYLYFLVLTGVLAFRRGRSTRVSGEGREGNGGLGAFYTLLALMLLGIVAVLGSRDVDTRTLLRANYFARTAMWQEVLEEGLRYPAKKYSTYLVHDIDRALYETGRFGSEMFAYPQSRFGLLPRGMAIVNYKGVVETLYSLGSINGAEHDAHVSLELRGDRPAIVRHLALINIVKKEPQIARIYLNALRKDPISRQWAQDTLRLLDADPLMSSNEEIEYARSLMPVEDSLFKGSEEILLRELLARNDKNRMAFEYLMAYCLLVGQLDRVVQNLGLLDNFDYQGVPAHYGEAVLLYSARAGRMPDLKGRKIDQDTIERFNRFNRILSDFSGNATAAIAALTTEMPNSYFRYYFTMAQSRGRR